MTTEVFGVTINWLSAFNVLLEGFLMGTGVVLAFLVWYLYINKLSKKKKESEV